MQAQKLTIETDGTMRGTVIKINDVQVAGIQQLKFEINGDPTSTISTAIKYWRHCDETSPMVMSTLKDDYASVYSVYITPYTGQLILDEDQIEWVTP